MTKSTKLATRDEPKISKSPAKKATKRSKRKDDLVICASDLSLLPEPTPQVPSNLIGV